MLTSTDIPANIGSSRKLSISQSEASSETHWIDPLETKPRTYLSCLDCAVIIMVIASAVGSRGWAEPAVRTSTSFRTSCLNFLPSQTFWGACLAYGIISTSISCIPLVSCLPCPVSFGLLYTLIAGIFPLNFFMVRVSTGGGGSFLFLASETDRKLI